MTALRDLFGVKDVVASMMLPDTYYRETPGMVLPEQLFGMELEIEEWSGRNAGLPTIMYETDNSLRGNAVEAITYPTRAKYFPALLKDFFAYHKVNENNYTERCSTHVHMNVQDYTLDNLKTLALLYQTIERLLFAYVGQDRQHNIFCVPWYESGVNANFISNFTRGYKSQVRTWVKYTALNFNPVSELGTVEFRHMYGTCDEGKLKAWLNLLSCMSKFAQATTSVDLKKIILNLNTISNYEWYLRDIFEEYTHLLMVEDYKSLLSVGVVDSKIMLLEPPSKKMTKIPPLDVHIEGVNFADDIAIDPERARVQQGQDQITVDQYNVEFDNTFLNRFIRG